MGLSDSVGAEISVRLSDQDDPQRAESPSDEPGLAEAAAAETGAAETGAESYWWPAAAESDLLCFPEAAPCGDSARLWLRGQYLVWWTKGNPLPALVSTSPPGTLWADAGVPETPGYEVVFGDQSIADEDRGGGWITLGYWLDDRRTVGLQADWFLVGNDKSTESFAMASAGTPILARPFYDVTFGQPDAALFAYPGLVEGALDVSTSSELNSGSVLLRKNWRSGSRGRIDLLGGYRHFCYREDLTLADNRKTLAPVGVCRAGTTLDSFDRFTTENDFDGGEFGLAAEFHRASWSLNLTGKVALGRVRQQLSIDGLTEIVIPAGEGQPEQAFVHDGGLFSQPTNLDHYRRSEFAVLPELDVNLEYHVTERFSLILGYTVVCLNRVLRTGDQIDTAVNSTQRADFDQPAGGLLVGPSRPIAPLRDTAFWAQGISLGVQLAR